MTYINSHKDQNWLIPQSIKEIIPKGHICFFVEEFVESLDFSNFDLIYAGPGHQNLGFREFLLRGLDKVKIEINLVSIAHNLRKIWGMRKVVECYRNGSKLSYIK